MLRVTLKARTLGTVCTILVAAAFFLVPPATQLATASADVYLDWQAENPGVGGRLVIENYPQVLDSGQTYKVDITLTLEWIDWGDTVQFQKINWLFDDGSSESPVLGYSIAHSNLTQKAPLSLSSHWSLQKTPLNTTGRLKIDTNITLKNSSQVEATRSPTNLQLTPPVRISYKIESNLNLTISPSIIRNGETLTIDGSIVPTEIRASIQLTYVKPNGDTVVRHVTTNGSGSFSDEYKPDVEGGWSVKAAWLGDEYHTASSSNTAAFTVNPPSRDLYILITVGLALAFFIYIGLPNLSRHSKSSTKILPT